MFSINPTTSNTNTELEVFEDLQSRIPLTQYRLPEGFYRCDLIDTTQPTPASPVGSESGHMSEVESESESESENESDIVVRNKHALIELDYSGGYPALKEEGIPFWHKLPHEGTTPYSIFQQYLLLPRRQGVRLLEDLHELQDEGEDTHSRFSLQELRELKILYLWEPRSKAFDAFDVSVRRKQRSVRSNKAEDKHYYLSEILLKKAMAFIQSKHFLEEMSPKIALEAFKLGLQTQRQALGLNPSGTTNEDSEALSPKLDMQFELHRVMNPDDPNSFHGNTNEFVTLPDGTQISKSNESTALKTQRILHDPEATKIAERLIIKMTSNSNSNSNSRGTE